MKAYALTGIEKFELTEIPKPEIKDGKDILLKVAYTGICGSDIHYYKYGGIGGQRIQYPWIIGHECTAVVEQTGTGVTKLKPGDRVVVDPLISCGTCPQCRAGRSHTCLNAKFMGCPGQIQGCLAEYIVMPENSCFRLDPETSLSEAVIIEPLSIGIFSVELLGKNPPKDIGIFGAGPIGLSVLIALKHAGFDSVCVTDKINNRLAAAEKYGAVLTGNPEQTDIVKDIICKCPSGLDALFECCGDQEALNQAVEVLKPGGKLLIIGIPPEEHVWFDISKIRRKEINIQNVRRQNNCMDKAVEIFRNSRLNAGKLVTHIHRFEDTPAAFENVKNYKDGVIKAVIQIS